MSHRLATGHGARRRRGAARLVALFAVLSLVAGACSRGDDDVATGGDDSSTTAPPDGTNDNGDGEAGPGDFGDLKGVCGPAEGDNADDTAQGVTSDEIQVGTISDPGFVGRQGLNQELFDASHVFVEWCNEAGGINGRQIKLVERDAKLTEYKQRITEACAEDFFLVGGGAVFDDTGQEERLGCLLPDDPRLPRLHRRPGAPTSRRRRCPAPSTRSRSASTSTSTRGSRTRSSNVGFMTGNVPSTVTVDEQNQEACRRRSAGTSSTRRSTTRPARPAGRRSPRRCRATA